MSLRTGKAKREKGQWSRGKKAATLQNKSIKQIDTAHISSKVSIVANLFGYIK